MASRGFFLKGNLKGGLRDIIRQKRGLRAFEENVKRRKTAGNKARHRTRKRGLLARIFG